MQQKLEKKRKKMTDDKEKIPSTLQDQAWKRAKENKEPRTGYPWDWLDYKDIKKKEEKDK